MFEGKELHEAVDRAEQQAKAMRPRLGRIDHVLGVIGEELRGVMLIALALAILCAPIGMGLIAVWFTGAIVADVTGRETLGWIAGIAVFVFLCRYVWGTRLQSAAKRAAAALVAGR